MDIGEPGPFQMCGWCAQAGAKDHAAVLEVLAWTNGWPWYHIDCLDALMDHMEGAQSYALEIVFYDVVKVMREG